MIQVVLPDCLKGFVWIVRMREESNLITQALNLGRHIMTISMSAPLNTSSSTTITNTTPLVLAFIFLINLLKFRLKPYNIAKRPPLPPGPAPWPILGNVPQMLRNKPTFRWLHLLMKEMNTDILCVRLGNVHVIPVTCPKIGLEFLKKQDAIFASRPLSVASRTFSNGYLSTALVPYGEQWKKMRKVLTSQILSPARHRWLHDKRVEEADNLVKYVFNECMSSGNVNIRTATRQYTGNVIRKLMFNKRYFGEGRKDGGPGIEEEEHVHALFSALAYLFAFCISDYFPFLAGLDLDGHEKIVKETDKIIKKYHEPIVNERIQKWRHADPNNSSIQKEPEDLLDVLINLKHENGKPLLTPEEIKAQTTEIMLAAVDNPANAVEWALAEMINKPEILQRAVEELDRVVGKERLVQESDIPHLNYLKACAREAFRLHPMVPFNIPHMSQADTTIAGYFIPKGSHILLSRTGLGRNPKVWDDPLKFKPERHLSNACQEVVLTEPNLGFLSFSTGRRGCIGTTLGTATTIMLLGRLLQGFTWTAPPNASAIDLTESTDNMFLAKPLVAHAEPRLPLNLYPLN